MKLLAVDGAMIAHSAGSLLTGGAFTITPGQASFVVKAGNKGCYKQVVAFTFSGGTYTGGVSGTATGTGTVSGTATKVKVENMSAVLLGDTGTVTGIHMIGQVPTPFSAPVEISDAGQTVVKGV